MSELPKLPGGIKITRATMSVNIVDVRKELTLLAKGRKAIEIRAKMGNPDAQRVLFLVAGLRVCQCGECQDRLAATAYAYRLAGLN